MVAPLLNIIVPLVLHSTVTPMDEVTLTNSELSTTVHVKSTWDPTGIGLMGSLVSVTDVGAGTFKKLL